MDTNASTSAVAPPLHARTTRVPEKQVRKKPEKNRRPTASSDPRRRFSITLSPKSAEAFDSLKDITDADTDSEVIRNALRVHYVLLQRSIAGDAFFVCSPGEAGVMTKIDLFVAK
jgi:hypothetical protein